MSVTEVLIFLLNTFYVLLVLAAHDSVAGLSLVTDTDYCRPATSHSSFSIAANAVYPTH